MLKNCLKPLNALYAGAVVWAVLPVRAALAESAHAVDGSHGADHGVDANAHHEGGGGGLPQLDTSTFAGQIFWLAVAFAIMYMIFSRRSLPEISGVLENRQNHIQSDLETAERLKSEASAAQQAYESGLQEARDAATSAMAEAQERVSAKAEKQAEAFREKADKEIMALEKSLETAKEGAMDDMNTIAAEIASEAAKKIVGIHADPEQAKTVVESLNTGTKKAA